MRNRAKEEKFHRRNATAPFALSLASAALLLLLAACDTQIVGGQEDEEPPRATATLSPTIVRGSLASGSVNEYNLVISPESGDSIFEVLEPNADGTATSGEIPVPVGNAVISVTAQVADATGNSFATTLLGFDTVEVVANENTELMIQMRITGSKVVMPDGDNGRIVMFDDVPTGSTTWTDVNWKELSITGTTVYDVDYDSQGRIWVAAGNNVYRVDNMNAAPQNMSEGLTLFAGEVPIVNTLSVDRINNTVTFYSGDPETGTGELYRAPTTASAPWTTSDLTNLSVNAGYSDAPNGIAVLPDGRVLSGLDGKVTLFNPADGSSSTIVSGEAGTFQDIRLVIPDLVQDISDGVIDNQIIYGIVANTFNTGTPAPGETAETVVHQITVSNGVVASYGVFDTSDPTNALDAGVEEFGYGAFTDVGGPVAFGATATASLYTAEYAQDNDSYPNLPRRVIKLDGLTWTAAAGSFGTSGEGVFQFFSPVFMEQTMN